MKKFLIKLLVIILFSTSLSYSSVVSTSINSINFENFNSFKNSIQENLFDKNKLDFNSNNLFKNAIEQELLDIDTKLFSENYDTTEFLIEYENYTEANFHISYDIYTNSVSYLKENYKYNENINLQLKKITTKTIASFFSIKANFTVITELPPEQIASQLSLTSMSLGLGALAVFGLNASDDGCTDPKLSISLSSSSITEGASTAILTASIDKALAANLVVPIVTSGTASSSSDYQSLSSITISAGSLSKSVTITSIDDNEYETSTAETIIFTASNVNGSTCPGSNMSRTLTIVDNDNAPTAQLSASANSIAEDAGSSIVLTATISSTTYQDVTIALGTSGTSTEGTDYSTVSDITISAGSLSGTTNFTPTNDTMYETSTAETAIIDITGVSGGDATESGTQKVNLSIVADSDAAPTVTFASSANSVAEDGSNLTLTATLSNPTYQNVTVSLAGTTNATYVAIEGTDYATVADITISSGSTTGTAVFNPTADSLYDASSNEKALIDVSGVSGGGATEQGTQEETITIIDAQSAPTVTLAAGATSIAEDGATNVTITATSSVATYANITVTLATSGTATDNTDYVLNDTITITAGSTSGTATFNPTSDAIYDATTNEVATIDISNVSGGSATESGTQRASITITDNESAPTLSIATDHTTRSETDSDATLTATLTNATYAAVTVDISTSGTATEGADYANMSNITIAAGSTSGTVKFNPTPDNIYDSLSSETAIVDVSVSGGSATESGAQKITYTLTDAQSAPTVTLASSSNTVYDSAGNLTITATLSVRTFENVTVEIDGTGGSATEGNDFATVSDITITAGNLDGTTSFNPTQDSTYEGTETATLAIDTVTGGGASENGTQTASISITEYALNLDTAYSYTSDSEADAYKALLIIGKMLGITMQIILMNS